MPISYPMPNWIGRTDVVTPYMEGMRIGVQEREAAARMAMAAQQHQQAAAQAQAQFQAEMQMKQEQHQQDLLLKIHQQAIDKAYNEAQLGLHRRQTEVAEQKAQREALEAARSWAATQAYQRDLAAAQTPEDRARVAMMHGPAISGSVAGLAPLARASVPVQAMSPNLQRVPGFQGMAYYTDRTGNLRVHNLPAADLPGSLSPQRRMQLTSQKQQLMAKRNQVLKAFMGQDPDVAIAMAGGPGVKNTALAQTLAMKKRELDQIDEQLRSLGSGVDTMPPGEEVSPDEEDGGAPTADWQDVGRGYTVQPVK